MVIMEANKSIDSLKLEMVLSVVSESMGVSIENIKGGSRKKAIIDARFIAMYLTKSSTIMSLKLIGSYFGGRDHTTVIHALNKVENYAEVDDNFKQTLSFCRTKMNRLIASKFSYNKEPFTIKNYLNG